MTASETISLQEIRDQFPILSRMIGKNPLVYLDNAATTQKPVAVLDAIADYYRLHNSNVHRGAHTISAEATDMFEKARTTIGDFVNAYATEGVVFTKGTTDGINLVATAWGNANVHAGDVVVCTAMEHHANIVPWQMLCERAGAHLHVIPVTPDGLLDLDDLRTLELQGAPVKLLAVTHVSNTLGTVNDVAALCAWARERGIATLVDGAQAVAHLPVDVQSIGCDFYVFSGHKIYAPTGIGALVARPEVLTAMPPYQGGGAMIDTVTFERTTYAGIPGRFEAGTPNIEGAVALGAALRWYTALDLTAVHEREHILLAGLHEAILSVEGARIIGPASGTAAVSFVVEGTHAADLGELLDQQGVAIRVGHHCTQPLLREFGLTSTARASVAAYTSEHDVAAFRAALHNAVRLLR